MYRVRRRPGSRRKKLLLAIDINDNTRGGLVGVPPFLPFSLFNTTKNWFLYRFLGFLSVSYENDGVGLPLGGPEQHGRQGEARD